MTNVPLDIRSGYSRADMNHPDFPAARHALDLEVRASGPPMPTDAALFDLFVKDWHREDSRPGSWCMRIGAIGKRAVYHLEYNPHGDADWRTVFGPGGWVEDAKGNADALLKIAIRARTRSGADAGASSKQPKRVSATTPADHEPDTSQQPLFRSAAVATEIIALLDERSEQLKDVSRYVTDRVDERTVRCLIDFGFRHLEGNVWLLVLQDRGTWCTDEEAEDWGRDEHQYFYHSESRSVFYDGDAPTESEDDEQRWQEDGLAPLRKASPPAAQPRHPEPLLPPLAPRTRQPLVRRPRLDTYVAADDFS